MSNNPLILTSDFSDLSLGEGGFMRLNIPGLRAPTKETGFLQNLTTGTKYFPKKPGF